MVTRADGIVLRDAVASDAEQVLTLVSQRLGTNDVPEAEVAFRDVTSSDGADDGQYLVVVDGDRVVAVLALWRERVRIGEVEVPAGQIDFVATAADHERRGIVRDLVDLAHERAAARGDLLQILIGIPYFYRPFGYAYAIPIPDPYDVPAAGEVPVAAGIAVRRARTDDLRAMQRLQDAVQTDFDIAMPHSAAAWRWLLEASTVDMRVVEDRDGVSGVARFKRLPSRSDDDDAPRISVAEVAATSIGVARALLADARATLGDGDIKVIDRPGTAVAALLAEVGRRIEERDEYLVRIVDPVALLDTLRPTLSARLATSPFAHEWPVAAVVLPVQRRAVVHQRRGDIGEAGGGDPATSSRRWGRHPTRSRGRAAVRAARRVAAGGMASGLQPRAQARPCRDPVPTGDRRRADVLPAVRRGSALLRCYAGPPGGVKDPSCSCGHVTVVSSGRPFRVTIGDDACGIVAAPPSYATAIAALAVAGSIWSRPSESLSQKSSDWVATKRADR
jgi:predicted N-acetyltransferase YhbS